MPGWASFFTNIDANPVRGMAQQRKSNSTQHLYWGDRYRIFTWDAVNVSIVGSAYHGELNGTINTPATTWSMEVWGDWVVATNGVDKPQIYTGTAFADIPNAPATAEIFLKRSPYLLAFNTSNDPRNVEWCSDDNLYDWSATSTNTAGSLRLHELDTGIVAAEHLGDFIGVYGNNTMHILNYTGAPFIFGQQMGLKGIGAVSKKAIIPVGRTHYGLSRQGFFTTDGVQFQYIDDPAVREWFKARMNWSQKSKVCGWHDADHTQVIWYYPTTTGEPEEGLGFDYTRNNWTIYDHGRTSAIGRDIYDYPVAANSVGELFYHGLGHDADGSALTSYIQTTPMALGSTELLKTLDNVKVALTGLEGSLSLYVGTQATLTSTVTWNGPYSVSEAYQAIYSRVSGRWITLKFISSAVGDAWAVSGFEVFGRRGGIR